MLARECGRGRARRPAGLQSCPEPGEAPEASRRARWWPGGEGEMLLQPRHASRAALPAASFCRWDAGFTAFVPVSPPVPQSALILDCLVSQRPLPSSPAPWAKLHPQPGMLPRGKGRGDALLPWASVFCTASYTATTNRSWKKLQGEAWQNVATQDFLSCR